MSTAAQDFITEAKYSELYSTLYIFNDYGHFYKTIAIEDHWFGHFIAAAINEKLQREKGGKG